MRRFDNRVVLVTGAAHGIGRAVAERLGGEGAAVAVVDIDHDGANKTARCLDDAGVSSLVLSCDVTDDHAVREAARRTTEHFGHLDVLVNNVGIASSGTFETMDDEDWWRQIDPTLMGAVRCIRAALPFLLESPRGGNVVSIGSVNGLGVSGNTPAYSAAKAGLLNLTRNLAAQYGPRGLRFNMVAPGTVKTRAWDAVPERLERRAQANPLRRAGTPDDVAAAVAYLASEEANWVTGVALPVDGGLLAAPMVRPPAET